MNVTILGLGSVLMGDDAVGPCLLRRLETRWELPPEVRLVVGGTPGPELLRALADADALIVVETVPAPGAEGQIHLHRRQAILAQPPGSGSSPHDPSLCAVLLAAELSGRGPHEVLLVSVVPAASASRTELSPAVREALPRLEAAVVGELARLGVAAYRRPAAERAVPDPGWGAVR